MKPSVGIVGLGLIGGSLAKAMKHFHLTSRLVAYDGSRESLLQARAEGVVDDFPQDPSQLADLFRGLDYIFLCCPVQVNLEYFRLLQGCTDRNTLITDVGSTKEDIMAAVRSMRAQSAFIGGHPMTGSEKTGYKASNPHLFENAFYLLTPAGLSDDQQLQGLLELLSSMGAIPMVVDPQTHDFFTAAISHVPHILASGLVNTVRCLDDSSGHMHTLAAGGFKDITRIASASPVMWQQISLTNRSSILQVLDRLLQELQGIRRSLADLDAVGIYDFFNQAKRYRDSFQDKGGRPLVQTYSVTVDVVDEPGIIAKIASTLSTHGINIKNIGINNNREDDPGVLEIVFYDKKSQQDSASLLSGLEYPVYVL
ncbi:prephenate dehydrogenase/arogenate dehydrogenase family protein [Anaerotalea alkaliphila]|uniref:Prephenate dehydrogenase n=1 Tax=Anaerotalea alkaliphila TaxID=2662126 RepID=A0A7X5KL00_9FIRM|nr:prephenate dehydrogenase/arogenate dehydrogenase family protein [Anaerotalea alkaliphila]NDL66184.1 prephenate dehydrogenase/arogenate dehydrogenase family protein [Anaerotalea alkaliphila]